MVPEPSEQEMRDLAAKAGEAVEVVAGPKPTQQQRLSLIALELDEVSDELRRLADEGE
jgi:hypothetical protein